MRLILSSLLLASLSLLACTNTPAMAQNSFTWEEEFNGRGAWSWNYYSTLSSENTVWRQVDWPFSFTYPGSAPLSENTAWTAEETFNKVVLSGSEVFASFMVPVPKELDDSRDLKQYCQEHINGSNQSIIREEALIVGGEPAYWVQYDSSSDSDPLEWTGTEHQREGSVVCIDLGNSWMNIYASQGMDEGEFKNILGSLYFGADEEQDKE